MKFTAKIVDSDWSNPDRISWRVVVGGFCVSVAMTNGSFSAGEIFGDWRRPAPRAAIAAAIAAVKTFMESRN
tara:strand:+ start:50 stop:265 length:216 start_codon:yes stop_codon:yes gene_type:complete